LKNTVNILSNAQEVSIDTTVPLTTGDIDCSGILSVDTIETKLSDHVQFDNHLSVTGNLYATGNLDIDGSATVDGQLAVSRIMHTNTSGAPTLGYRNEGTKLVLYENLSGSTLDYSIGIEPYNMFFTVGDSASGYKFYGGPAVAATIFGNGDINAAGSITATGTIAGASAQITNNCTIGGTCTITGALTTTAFYDAKPWVGFYCGLSAVSATVKPGYQQTGISVSKTATGTYVITIPTHPKGVNYMVFVQQQTAASTTAIAVYGTLVNTATSFTVWSKTTANVLVDSNFYVYTVP
jgi:hypothetical protein